MESIKSFKGRIIYMIIFNLIYLTFNSLCNFFSQGFCSFFAFNNYSSEEQQLVKCAYFTIIDHAEKPLPAEYLSNPTTYEELYTMVRNGVHRDRGLDSKPDESRPREKQSSPTNKALSPHDKADRDRRDERDKDRERDRDRDRERDRDDSRREERPALDSRPGDWDRNIPSSTTDRRQSPVREWDRDRDRTNDWDRNLPVRDTPVERNDDWDRTRRDRDRDTPSAASVRRDDPPAQWDPSPSVLAKRARSPSFGVSDAKRYSRDLSPVRAREVSPVRQSSVIRTRDNIDLQGWLSGNNSGSTTSRELTELFYRELEDWNIKNIQLVSDFEFFADKVKAHALRQMELLESLARLVERVRNEQSQQLDSGDFFSRAKQFLQLSQPSRTRP
jgi:hypothetical protein